jgi:endogenous inhibitor of DNA gyrase (YacG/DUF329 family)
VITLTTEQRRALAGECLACGTPLPEDAGVRRLYCTRRCLRAFHRGDVVREPSTCQHCTRPLPADAHPLRRYCSQAHRQAAWVQRHTARRACPQCGADMTERARQARHCSDRCRDRARRTRERAAT